MGSPQHTSSRRPADLQVFIVVIAAIILIAGAVQAVQAVTGDDSPATGGVNAGEDVDSTNGDGTSAGVTVTTGADVEDGDGGAGTSDTTAPGDASGDLAPLQGLAFEPLVTELDGLTYATQPVGETSRLFVLQRTGRIFLIENDSLVSDPFLDLRDRVGAAGIEQGLLGLAFHPEYAANGRFFVYYTDKEGRRQLSEFSAPSADSDTADLDSEKVLFEFAQPERASDIRHYGGMVMFGPDGYLYVSLGDGANASDQGQNPETFFATIVRLDVDGGDPYAIPADNPFVDGGGAPEVWVYGLRNPWRFTIDSVDNVLIVADVGLEKREEVDVLDLATDAGANLGWPNIEGDSCFRENPCDIADYHVPVVVYTHEDGNCSITGGHVYRGEAIPEITGHYFYTDWCTGWIRSFRLEDGAIVEEQDWTEDLGRQANINAFGIDTAGELYIVTHTGTLARLVAER
jgi:glucose/arabinose dehydrogenase